VTHSRTDLLLSLLASTVRGWRGTQVRAGVLRRPETPPRLYDDEGDPDCRLVRELLTELDLDVLLYPCPPGGRRFRRDLAADEVLPVLIDTDTGTRSAGLQAVARHLLQHYGGSSDDTTEAATTGWLARLGSELASRLRPAAGRPSRPSRKPRQPLELYSFESSPYSRRVRERLCELQLPYLLRSLGKQQLSDYGPPHLRPTLKPYQPVSGSRREQLKQTTGKVQVPYLIDPNSGRELFESQAIIEYLERRYAR